MAEREYNVNIILKEIENIHANFIDLSNVCVASQLESIVEIFTSLSIIKLSCKRLILINDFNIKKLEEIIDKIESISLYTLLNVEDKSTQLDAIINLGYIVGIIITKFDSYL